MSDTDSLTIGTAGKYFDGNTAVKHDVTVRLDQGPSQEPGLLIIQSTKGTVLASWKLSDLRQARDQARGTGMVLFNSDANMARLILPDSKACAKITTLAANLHKRKKNPALLRRVMVWGGVASAAVVLILFVLVPALANQLANSMAPEKEIALGRQALTQIERVMGAETKGDLTCNAPDGRQALDKMTARLTQTAAIPYDLDVRVFNNDTINAFALPGGHIVLVDGLLQAADSPEEVAGVLAHEMGHVINRDPTRLTLQAAGTVGILGMVLGDFSGGALVLLLTEKLVRASYSQKAETLADMFSIKTLAQSKLPSAPFGQFFLKLETKYGDQPGLLSHLASHPDLTGRAQNAANGDTIGNVDFAAVLTAGEWQDLKSICH